MISRTCLCVCVCVFFVLLVFFLSAFLAFGANHLLLGGLRFPWSPAVLGVAASLSFSQWVPWVTVGLMNPPFRPQPRVIESIPPFLQSAAVP